MAPALHSIAGFDISLEAAADLSTKQYYLVKVDNTGKAALCGAGQAAVGVLQDKPTSGQFGQVQTSKVSPCVAGVAIAAGDLIASDASGKAKVAVAGKVAGGAGDPANDPTLGSHVIGVALTAAAADGEQFSLLIQPRGAIPGTAS